LIARPRLLSLAPQLSAKRLAVISAPAGFGKTSLAMAWLQDLQDNDNGVAWLTVDAEDNEPAAFVFYVSHALGRANQKAGSAAIALTEESSFIDPRAIISTLINDLADIDEEMFLFLEDYHWINNPEIHEVLAFFLRNIASNCHVVLTTRTVPPLPLASLRAQNRLLEIDASALRFDIEETRKFVETEGLGALGPADVRLLREKTDGWPAAMRIVTSTSGQSHQDLAQYVRSLSGMQRSIGAYLGELLEGFPGDLVQFMLRTAVLDRLCAPLCEVVAGVGPGQDWLESIRQRQLLLTSLDQEGFWFRYHPLLVEYLGHRLESDLSNEIPGLHQRAAVWYASQEMWTDAVRHAFAAGDAVRALEWIKNCAMQLVKQGDLFTLLGWQRLFPAALVRGQPEVGLAIAWGLALANRYDEALERLADVERDIEAQLPQNRETLFNECNSIRSVALALKDDGELALAEAEECLGRSADPWCANVVSNVVRFGYLKRGDLKRFYATPWIPYSVEQDRRNLFASVYYRSIQGMAEAQQMRIGAAERYYLQALRLAEQYVGPNSVAAALPSGFLARVRYDQGRIDEAESILLERMSLVSAGTMLDCVLNAYFVMARIAIHRLNFGLANTLFEREENLGDARGWGRLTAAAVLERMRLCLSEGRIDEGVELHNRLKRIAVQFPAPTNCARSDISRYVTVGSAYIASAQQRFDDAISTLTPLQRDLENIHNRHFALQIAMRIAALKFRQRQAGEAIGLFGKVAAAFAQAGLRRTILDEGRDIGPLLMAFQESVAQTGGTSDLHSFISGLVSEWKSHNQPQQNQPIPPAMTAGPLSQRERDILKLIAAGLSNKEIARDLAIAPETVKSHIKNIFTKLNVERRIQAVSIAQNLGLVEIQQ
jgi:LuxR family transcriptional regulator, maltose regulon positive regulatory protein